MTFQEYRALWSDMVLHQKKTSSSRSHNVVLLLVTVCLAGLCAAQQPPDLTDIRLVDGPAHAPNSGRVEAFHSTGVWLNVCDFNYWGDNDGEVACRQLGFPGYSRVRRESYFGEGTNNGSVGAITCNGDEGSLGQCQHGPVRESVTCEGRVAGLICTVPGFLGCYSDDRNNRVFTHPRFRASNMTIGICLGHCRSLALRYAGLESKRDCYCGDEGTQIDRHGKLRDRDCMSDCSGNVDEVCGSKERLSIYDLTLGHCSDPGIPVNGGRVSSSRHVFSYASKVTFYCNDGFELLGSDTTICVLGDSPQEVKWDAPLPQCIDEGMWTTQNPDSGDKQTTASAIGKIVGIVITCVVLLVLLVILTIIIRKRNRSNKNAHETSGLQLDNVYAEPGDPTRYQTSQVANTQYQELALPSKDTDGSYTSLKKRESQQEPVKDIPEYLEFDDDDNSEYTSIGTAGGIDVANSAVGGGKSVSSAKRQHLPSPEINENEYSYVDSSQLSKDFKEGVNNKTQDDTENHDHNAESGPMYYSLPPDAN